jgi:IS30 family transposase
MASYQRLTLHERAQIERYLKKGLSKAEIARRLKRHRSTIGNEINRWGAPKDYNCGLADWNAMDERTRPRKKKLARNYFLRRFVLEHLRIRWSPEQIAATLKALYPENHQMNTSHESIYTYIYLLARGELRRELIGYLRQAKGKRYRKRGGTNRSRIPDRVCIDQRDPAVEDRTIPEHWESDLIIGAGQKSAIGTIVERTTRFLIIVFLRGRTAPEVRKAFARELRRLPQHLRLSLTHDNGLEMAQHKLFTKNTRMAVYFAHPYSSWERGTNENTNGLIRDFFPKGTDFSTVSRYKIKKVQDMLNARPRKVLGWRTPAEALQELLSA